MIADILFKGQESLLVLISAFIIGGVFKTNKVFAQLFTLVVNKVQSKRLGLFFISLISGVLPVEGRVTVSAPILDSLIKEDHTCTDCNAVHKRGKMGILDYVSTHHYYLWSPLEKSVIILMSGLSLSYAQFISYTIFPLLVYLAFLTYTVFFFIKEEEIEIINTKSPVYFSDIFDVLPFFLGIVLSIIFEAQYVFPFIALFYVLKYNISVLRAINSVKWETVLFVALVIIAANIAKANADHIQNLIKSVSANHTGWVNGFVFTVGFAASVILGSSSKYAGIAVLLTLIYGMQAFPIILMAEYAGYLISPTHKCVVISASYFGTKPKEFYTHIGILMFLMIFTGFMQTLFLF